MNARTTLTLGLVFAVLAGAAFMMERNRQAEKSPEGDRLFPKLNSEKVTEIGIRKGNVEVQLAKQDGVWLSMLENEKPADPKLIEELLGDLDQVTNVGLVSTNPENHTTYEVGDTGVAVDIKQDDGTTVSMIVGKPGTDFMSTYIRRDGADETYRIPVYLRTKVDRGGRTWRKETFLDIPQSDIARVTLKGEHTAVMENVGGSWKMIEPFRGTVDPSLQSVIVSSLSKLRSTGFADTVSVAAAGLDSPTQTMEIETKDGTKHFVEIGYTNERQQTYTRLQGDDQIYLVPLGRWNTIFRDPAELALPDPEPTEESGAEDSGDVEATSGAEGG